MGKGAGGVGTTGIASTTKFLKTHQKFNISSTPEFLHVVQWFICTFDIYQ